MGKYPRNLRRAKKRFPEGKRHAFFKLRRKITGNFTFYKEFYLKTDPSNY